MKNLLRVILDVINRIYPPAVWLGNAMLAGYFVACFGCVCAGLLVLVFVIGVLSVNYTRICDEIFNTSARHDYQMEHLKSTYVLGALYKREFKRYVASSIYVTNTIISPIMGMLFAGAMLFITLEQMKTTEVEFYVQSGMMFGAYGSYRTKGYTCRICMASACTIFIYDVFLCIRADCEFKTSRV